MDLLIQNLYFFWYGMAKVNRTMNSNNTDMGNPHAVHDFHMHNLEVKSPCRMDAQS